jgi:toxin YoeB
MEIAYTDVANKDVAYWKKTSNVRVQQRITALLDSIKLDPFTGIGKPEKLKHGLSGKMSRRIDSENRLVYEVQENLVIIHSMRGHY